MRFIKKAGHEPPYLKTFREEIEKSEIEYERPYDELYNSQVEFNGVFPFIALQRQLAEEQGYICCYCMGEIKRREGADGRPIPIMRVEHFKPKSIFNGRITRPDLIKHLCLKNNGVKKDLQIDYYNLFCACPEKVGTDRHCDVKKGKDELCYVPNPSDKTKSRFFDSIKYTFSGKLISPAAAETDIKETLNLNCNKLTDKRKAIWSAISDILTKAAGNTDWNKGSAGLKRKVEDLIEKYSKPRVNGDYYEFCDFVLYLLKKRFRNILES